jgi:hypothetical protein
LATHRSLRRMPRAAATVAATIFLALLASVIGGIALVSFPSLSNYRVLGTSCITHKDGSGYTCTTTTICSPLASGNSTPTSDMNSTQFQILGFSYTGIATSSGAYQVGVSRLSNDSSGAVEVIRAGTGTIGASYTPRNGATITHCGITFCQGSNCTPTISLETENVVVKDVYTREVCFPDPCRLPGTQMSFGISASSPAMRADKPYTYKLYLQDSTGFYVAWIWSIEYVPG